MCMCMGVCRYVFKGHPIPRESEKKDSLTKESICPTPPPLVEAFLKIPGSTIHTIISYHILKVLKCISPTLNFIIIEL